MIRRAFDICVALLALLLAALPMAVVALLVKSLSPGPVLYRQTRIGRGGGRFVLYKFRTMHAGAPGAQVTAAGDARVYPLGRWLRRWKLDELPQFWNVLRGDMSIVGPRPEVERFVRHYTAAERQVLEGKPGLASVSALACADEAAILQAATDPEATYIRDVMPRKVAIDIEYENSRTIYSDLKLLGALVLFIAGWNTRLDHTAPGTAHGRQR